MNNFTFSKILWRIQDLHSGRSPELQSHCEAFPKLSTLCKQQLSVLEIRSRRVLPEPSQPQRPWQCSGVPPVIRATGASQEQLWGAEAALGKPSPAARPPSTATADPPGKRRRTASSSLSHPRRERKQEPKDALTKDLRRRFTISCPRQGRA